MLITHVDLLRASFTHVMRLHPWRIDAIVILPDHLHALCTLPTGDADFAVRWRLIKSGFSRALPPSERIPSSRQRKGERGIWQQLFWEHRIRDDEDFARHVDYIHHNPRKHGHVERVLDWPWSSFHRYVAAGLLPADWARDGSDEIFTGEGL